MKNCLTISFLFFAAAALLAAGCEGGADYYKTNAPSQIDAARAYTDARDTLRQAAEDASPETRAHAIEAMAKAAPRDSGPLLKQALKDPHPLVRFAAAMGIGDTGYVNALGDLQRMATLGSGERDRRVYPAVIYAMHKLGDSSHVTHLAQLLRDPEPEVRSNAALVIGRLREPSAIRPLKMLLDGEHNENVMYSLREALAILGDPTSSALLESYARGYYLDLRLAAIPVLGMERSQDSILLLRELTGDRNPPRIRVSAAGALAELGEVDEACYRLCLNALSAPDEVMELGGDTDAVILGTEPASLQRLSAMALGSMGRQQAVPYLHRLLPNENGAVRVAAAMGIIQLVGKAIEPPAPPAIENAPEASPTLPAAASPGELQSAGAKD